MSQNRKDEHLYFANHFYTKESQADFDQLTFVHHSLPEIAESDISIKTQFAHFDVETPFFINAMTGGSKHAYQVNRDLALVAKETGLLMATGSASILLKEPEQIASFQVIREVNPKGLLITNIGAEHPVEHAKRIIDLLEANALQVHVNVPQELVMPEGARTFTGWLKNIETMVKELPVPVIVKEVGFGMSKETIKQLKNIGVKTIDLSGNGGTSFTQIENARREQKEYAFLENWGQSTVISLLESQEFQSQIEILASGGIRSPFDVIKVLALGAKSVGVAGHFLHSILKNNVEETVVEIESWKTQLKTLMMLLGKKNLLELQTTDLVLSPYLAHWCQARGINWQGFAQRSNKP